MRKIETYRVWMGGGGPSEGADNFMTAVCEDDPHAKFSFYPTRDWVLIVADYYKEATTLSTSRAFE